MGHAESPPLVFVTAGTDACPFDRIVDWAEEATLGLPVRLVIQHGTGRAPDPPAEGYPYLTGDRMESLLTEASLVVCSAGPGALMDARAAGRLPVLVPRRPGEHVDGHQVAFSAHAERVGLAPVAHSAAELRHCVVQMLADPGAFRVVPPDRTTPTPGVIRIGEEIEALVRDPTRVRRRGWFRGRA